MVERPIKKSERAAREAQEGNSDREGRSNERRDRDRKGRKGGKGRDRRDREEKKPAVSPALMRGPKPQAKVEEPEPEATTVEAVDDDTAEITPTADMAIAEEGPAADAEKTE